jgi:hypothetical protein
VSVDRFHEAMQLDRFLATYLGERMVERDGSHAQR